MSDVESELDDLLRELDSSPRWASSQRKWVDDPALLQVVLEAASRPTRPASSSTLSSRHAPNRRISSRGGP
ncbi:hypothetical protein ACIRRH_42720 [Kitasatospora sp. NPDC101235]|uniref:hypothetical protein n=1 Tax=Kitasatospora sp. NPDC101235 TaxID=3364101 RepID=UPI0038169831